MTFDPARLVEARRLRDAAREIVVADLQELKEEYAPNGLLRRARAQVSDEVHGLLDQAKDITRESKPIIAIMVAALVGWFARHRLLAAWQWFTRDKSSEEADHDSQWKEED